MKIPSNKFIKAVHHHWFYNGLYRQWIQKYFLTDFDEQGIILKMNYFKRKDSFTDFEKASFLLKTILLKNTVFSRRDNKWIYIIYFVLL